MEYLLRLRIIPLHILSYDEKPGIQAIATTPDDLMPDELHFTISVIMSIKG